MDEHNSAMEWEKYGVKECAVTSMLLQRMEKSLQKFNHAEHRKRDEEIIRSRSYQESVKKFSEVHLPVDHSSLG